MRDIGDEQIQCRVALIFFDVVENQKHVLGLMHGIVKRMMIDAEFGRGRNPWIQRFQRAEASLIPVMPWDRIVEPTIELFHVRQIKGGSIAPHDNFFARGKRAAKQREIPSNLLWVSLVVILKHFRNGFGRLLRPPFQRFDFRGKAERFHLFRAKDAIEPIDNLIFADFHRANGQNHRAWALAESLDVQHNMRCIFHIVVAIPLTGH